MNFPKKLSSEDMSLIIKEWKLAGCHVQVTDDHIYVSASRDNFRYYHLRGGEWVGRMSWTVTYTDYEYGDPWYAEAEEEDFFSRPRRKTKRDGPDQE